MVAIEFKQERLTPALEKQGLPLAREWWEQQQGSPFDPQMIVYYHLQRQGMMRLFTVYNADELIGYAIFLVSRCLFSGDFYAQADHLILKPEERKGFTGIKFLKFCISRLQEEDFRVVMNISPVRDFSPILRRLGFTKFTETYSLEV